MVGQTLNESGPGPNSQMGGQPQLGHEPQPHGGFLTTVYTIGHSNHSLPHFMSLLQSYGISVVVDVRSVPYSRRHPQFNRKNLERELKAHRIEYVFLGRELGGRPDDPGCYVDGRVDFGRLAARETFKSGILRLIQEAESRTVAVMCAEKEPLACHRTLLVGEALVEVGMQVAHILADGSLESHEQTMDRHLGRSSLPVRLLCKQKG